MVCQVQGQREGLRRGANVEDRLPPQAKVFDKHGNAGRRKTQAELVINHRARARFLSLSLGWVVGITVALRSQYGTEPLMDADER
jgi:hypothetical protein